MKKIPKAIPFALVLALMLGSVATARLIHSKPSDHYHVNTGPDRNGKLYSIRVFESVSSVLVIDGDRHSRKRKIPESEYRYDPETTELVLAKPLPYERTVVHMEGKIALPERFCLYDFAGEADSLLVLLDGREAMENYEYTFNPQGRILTFRNDIHPENDGLFHIMYMTEAGEMHSFGNWGEKDGDRLSELQGKWLSRTQNIPMTVMKDRSSVSDRKLSKEAGFRIQIPKGDSTFLVENVEDGEKALSVMRWYDKAGLVVECRGKPFPNDGREKGDGHCDGEILHLGKTDVSKRLVRGTRSDGSGAEEEVPLAVYGWQTGGTFYQMTVDADKAHAAEDWLGSL